MAIRPPQVDRVEPPIVYTPRRATAGLSVHFLSSKVNESLPGLTRVGRNLGSDVAPGAYRGSADLRAALTDLAAKSSL